MGPQCPIAPSPQGPVGEVAERFIPQALKGRPEGTPWPPQPQNGRVGGGSAEEVHNRLADGIHLGIGELRKHRQAEDLLARRFGHG